ncbi:MAG: Cfr10I/Bse634I family restriction endonuclease [Erythrobacter sp.]|uniref:Cfr10I/Bse634I family restriction endonuclease n=1 Tax=Erythrobacter sp. TaxID=1042 RepID=UPI0032EBB79A
MKRFPLNGTREFQTVLDECQRLVLSEHPLVKSGALGNARGRWYEWLIALAAEEYFVSFKPACRLIPLPNINSFDCAHLYQDEIAEIVTDLRAKVLSAGKVALVTSNPDFVIVRKDRAKGPVTGTIKEKIEKIDHLYRDVARTCFLDDILGYGAAKLSLRSDRRYQIPHEGSLFKALYRHIQTREWLINARGIKYYALAMQFTRKDLEALRTVATHSIVDVGSLPQRAVDESFTIDGEAALATSLSQILN